MASRRPLLFPKSLEGPRLFQLINTEVANCLPTKCTGAWPGGDQEIRGMRVETPGGEHTGLPASGGTETCGCQASPARRGRSVVANPGQLGQGGTVAAGGRGYCAPEGQLRGPMCAQQAGPRTLARSAAPAPAVVPGPRRGGLTLRRVGSSARRGPGARQAGGPSGRAGRCLGRCSRVPSLRANRTREAGHGFPEEAPAAEPGASADGRAEPTRHSAWPTRLAQFHL